MIYTDQISIFEKALDYTWRLIAVCHHCGYRREIVLDQPVAINTLKEDLGFKCVRCGRDLS